MPTVEVNGLPLYYEEAGDGFPLVFTHEFGGSYASWEPQLRFFSRRYRVITWAQRGFPPLPAPEDPGAYSQDHSVEDLRGLLRHLGVGQAHLVGLSMGGHVTLHFGFSYPERCRSLVLAGIGAGSLNREQAIRGFEETAARLEREGIEPHAEQYAGQRTQLRAKDPRGWEEFRAALRRHSARGRASTLRGVQARRPSLFQLEAELRALRPPTLIIVGDEDEACVEPSLFARRSIPACGMVMFPRTGHTVNLEEPDLFNRTVLDFLTAVEQDAWWPTAQRAGVAAEAPPR
jgi:pimeloyl-ACP methyl ester carboxylesterase